MDKVVTAVVPGNDPAKPTVLANFLYGDESYSISIDVESSLVKISTVIDGDDVVLINPERVARACQDACEWAHELIVGPPITPHIDALFRALYRVALESIRLPKDPQDYESARLYRIDIERDVERAILLAIRSIPTYSVQKVYRAWAEIGFAELLRQAL